jgi:hypothetical protein
MDKTTDENKSYILADLWMNFRDDEQFQDFVEYNDLGLPLAYAITNGIVKVTEKSQSMIDETFMLLLAGLGINEDPGFESLDDVLSEGQSE